MHSRAARAQASPLQFDVGEGKDEIDRLASIMHGLHLTMKAKPKRSLLSVQERSSMHEPPFDELLAYSDAPIEDNYHVLAPTVAEIVAHQITLKDMRGKGEGGPAAAAITTPAKGDSQSGENGRGMKRDAQQRRGRRLFW